MRCDVSQQLMKEKRTTSLNVGTIKLDYGDYDFSAVFIIAIEWQRTFDHDHVDINGTDGWLR